MEIIKGDISRLEPRPGACGLTIGNFDGVHLGHQKLVGELIKRCHQKGVQAIVLSFDPHPEEFLSGQKVDRLTSLEGKAQLLENLGVDVLVVQKFDENFSRITHEDFLRQYLCSFFEISDLFLGYDFRFGNGGEGTFSYAKKYFEPLAVNVEQLPALEIDGETVSSSSIRSALKVGDVQKASKLLGRNYSVSGQVVKGKALGRTLGFPTANLEACTSVLPATGVYAGTAHIRGQEYPAISNVGKKPTVSNQENVNLECHVFDFSETIYQEKLRFCFEHRIRSEKKFCGVDELKNQISLDIAQAKSLLGL